MLDKIELIKDENREDEVNWVSISCKSYDVHELAVLKEALQNVGIELSLSKINNSDILMFSLHHYKEKTSRNAGRKKDYSMHSKYKECTVSELKMRLLTMKKSEIIKDLGCPKSTFYRILNNLKERECIFDGEDAFMDNDSIWLYTN